MAEFRISIDDKLIPVLQALAKYRGLDSIEEAVATLLSEQISELESRTSDPLIGMLSSGEGDISERDEDILYGQWKPD